MKTIKTSILLSVLSLTACSTAVKYTCNDIEGTNCHSLSTTAEQTAYAIPSTGKSLSETANLDRNKPLYSHKLAGKQLSYVDAGKPMLTEPWVAGIYFTPHVDAQGDLDAGGYVYMKVSDSQWVLKK